MQMPDSNSQWASRLLASGEPGGMAVVIKCWGWIDAQLSEDSTRSLSLLCGSQGMRANGKTHRG